MNNESGQLDVSGYRPAVDQRALSQHTHAGEHLVGYVDLVLEAFQSGVGIRNNAPEPITIDIARRLIWSEIRRTMRNLVEDLGSGVDVEQLAKQLWVRLDGPDGTAILNALNKIGGVTWSVRCYGGREEGHTAVAYAVAAPVRNAVDAAAMLQVLKDSGIGVRDWTLGAYPY